MFRPTFTFTRSRCAPCTRNNLWLAEMSIVVRLQIFRKIQSQTNDNRILFVGDGQVDRVLLWSLICLCMCRCLSLCRCLSFPPTRWPNYIVQRTWPNWTKIINSIRIVFRDDATGLSTLKHCEKLQSLGVDGSLPVCVSTRVCVCASLFVGQVLTVFMHMFVCLLLAPMRVIQCEFACSLLFFCFPSHSPLTCACVYHCL